MDLAQLATQLPFPVAVAAFLLWKLHKNEERCAKENAELREKISAIESKDQDTLRELGRTMRETNKLVRHIFKIVDDADHSDPRRAAEESDTRAPAAEAPSETLLRSIR